MMASLQTILEEKIVELEKTDKKPQNSQPKIQKVPEHLRNRSNYYDKYYSPKLVSIGPIHHDNRNLKLGEKYKLMWAAKYIKNISETPHNLHKKIADNIDELKGHFADDVLTSSADYMEGFLRLDEKLSWMLLVDGCGLLYILNERYDRLMDIKMDQLILVMMDLLLLENQLPYLVLKLLWKNDNETELIESMKYLLGYFRATTSYINQETSLEEHSVEVLMRNESELPIHLLDLLRKIMRPQPHSEEHTTSKGNIETSNTPITFRNIQHLKAAGISVTPSRTSMLSDIHFSNGWFPPKLSLPFLSLNNTTITSYLNLIAYEMCTDFDNDYAISSFAYFMNSLIDNSEDVKELRSSGILLNSLGSDEEVADVFNIICADLVCDIGIYYQVRSKMNDHCRNNCKIWIALFIQFHRYFSNPDQLAIQVFAFSVIAAWLTLIQTWLAIHPTRK